MSSTKGSKQRKKKDENYPTPSFATKAILERLKPHGDILEPCAGEGAIIETAWSVYFCELCQNSGVEIGTDLCCKRCCCEANGKDSQATRWYAVEIRQEAYETLDNLYISGDVEAFTIRDFLDTKPLPLPFPEKFDWVITNPPYSMAQKMI